MVDVNEIITTTIEKAIQSCRNAGATDSEIRIAFNQLMQSNIN